MKKNTACLVLLICCLQYQVIRGADSPYSLSFKNETALLVSGTGLGYWGWHRSHQVPPLTVSEIEQLSRADINRLDRAAASWWSGSAQQWSDRWLYSYAVLPAVLVLGNSSLRKDFRTISILYLESALFTLGMNHLAKGVFQRIRPYPYNPEVLLARKTQPDARRSFYSGHAATTFASAVFSAQIFSDYFPESRWKPLVWGTALTGAGLVAYLRVRGGMHFPTDVQTGAVMGSVTSWLILKQHRAKSSQSYSLDIRPPWQLSVSFSF